jgi:transcriptional regulator EpsA
MIEPVTSPRLAGRDFESLFLNMDASLRVGARPSLCSWTQGLLQGLIRHPLLICALRRRGSQAFRTDSFSMAVADAATFGTLLLRDAASGLIRIWTERHFVPTICTTEDVGDGARTEFWRELERAGIDELLVHGAHDTHGEARSLFVFACVPGSCGSRELALAELITPMLDAACVRAHMREALRGEAREGPGRSGVLSERERDVLRWISLGKSNAEIGTILGISPLTVKNHVQKVLRKLDVVNRAQAVGKALEAGIISSA